MLIIEDYNERKKIHREELAWVAYVSARLQRSAKLPPWDKVVQGLHQKQNEQKERTPEDMLAAVKRLQSQFEREEG